MMNDKYVVCGDERYYPWVYEFVSLEEAEKEYIRSNSNGDYLKSNIYLCKIIKKKVSR